VRFFRIHRFVSRAGASSIVLTEHHTQRVLESKGPRAQLRVQDNVLLLREHTDYFSKVAGRIGRMARWQGANLGNPRMVAVIERFHLTHVLNYEHLDWAHVVDIDAQLAELGIYLCSVIAAPSELRRRLSSDRADAWGSFLSEPGQRGCFAEHPSDEAKARYFAKQQEALLTLAERSRMPKFQVDTTETSPLLAAEAVLRLLVGDLQDEVRRTRRCSWRPAKPAAAERQIVWQRRSPRWLSCRDHQFEPDAADEAAQGAHGRRRDGMADAPVSSGRCARDDLRYAEFMSPTVLRAGGYRFYFFSREEPRPHVHVQHADGEAKFWLEPEIGLAQNHGLSARQIATALRLVRKNHDEIRAAWKAHFGS
jgi:hypothetical protein